MFLLKWLTTFFVLTGTWIVCEIVDESWCVSHYLVIIPPDRDAPVKKAVTGILDVTLHPFWGRLILLGHMVLHL
jgi:hypothetical protein